MPHPSDWVCAGCAVVNFGSRSRCIECFAAAQRPACPRATRTLWMVAAGLPGCKIAKMLKKMRKIDENIG